MGMPRPCRAARGCAPEGPPEQKGTTNYGQPMTAGEYTTVASAG